MIYSHINEITGRDPGGGVKHGMVPVHAVESTSCTDLVPPRYERAGHAGQRTRRVYSQREKKVNAMPTYLFRLVADSSVRISELPYLDKNLYAYSLTLNGQFRAALFDNAILLKDIEVPKGLIIQIQLDSADITSAILDAEGAATYVLSMLSCVTNASILQPKPLWGYDAAPGLSEREVVAFAYEYSVHANTRPVYAANWSALLEAKFNGLKTRPSFTDDMKDRLQRAVRAFRRGLADTEDMLDEFLVHWSSLETLDVVYRKVFQHQDSNHFTTCGGCKTTFNHCPVCGNPGVFRQPQKHTGIEAVFACLKQSEKYNQLKRLRNGISHGYESLSKCYEMASDNIELVRKAVLTMILQILGVEDDARASIIANRGKKGKSVPHFRVYAKGVFEPGDAGRFETQPDIGLRCSNLEVYIKGKQVILNPTWEFTNKAIKITAAEFFADEGAELTVTDDISFLSDDTDLQSSPAAG